MDSVLPRQHKGRLAFSAQLRGFLALILRRRKMVVSTFLTLLCGTILGTLLMPKEYEAEMKLLLNRERSDPVLTSDPSAPPIRRDEVSDNELNSEVELLRSQDLLEKVVRKSGLHLFQPHSFVGSIFAPSAAKDPTPGAVRKLRDALRIERIKATQMIRVAYRSRDPEQAARVLDTLVGLFLEKHVEVRRPRGAFDFFQQQVEHYRKEMEDAKSHLEKFKRTEGIVSPTLEKDEALKKLSEFEAALQTQKAAVMEIQGRIASLEMLTVNSPARMTTTVRTSNTSPYLDHLKTTLMDLELKRTELLGKFDASYPQVRDVEKQIAQTQAAIAIAEQNPGREEFTDRDPTHELLRSELARARAELDAMNKRMAAAAQSVRFYQARAHVLGEKEQREQDLTRATKASEDNFLLYSRKKEEARISDALDRQRIVNVAIAEAPTVPALPVQLGWSFKLLLAGLLSSLASVSVAFVYDRIDPTFRSPDEVKDYLDVPVLAALSKKNP